MTAVAALAFVAGAAPFHHVADQDRSRFCLTHALIHGELAVDRCIQGSVDRSRRGGHLYSNKAPGMSLFAVPAFGVAALVDGEHDHGLPGGRWIWLLRALTSGFAFAATAAILVQLGGVSAAVAYCAASPALAFAATAYDHVPAGALLLAAFAAAIRRRPGLAGVAAGAAVLTEYQSLFAWLVLAVYVLRSQQLRSTARYVAASIPSLVLLGAYDWLAFGAPWHNPLRYSDNQYESAHAKGFLGIHAPSLHGFYLVVLGQKGLLVTSPVLLAGAVGLAAMAKKQRREAAVCIAIAAAYLAAECGYFDPYAGFSPGPRYVIPALPFLALGVPYAVARWRGAVLSLLAVSTVSSVAIALTWARGANDYQDTIWRQLAALVAHGSAATLATVGAPIVLSVPHRALADAAVVGGAALALFVAASRTSR